MPRLVQIVFGLIALVAIIYLALVGLNAFFDWINPGASSGRTARLTIGLIVGLVATLVVIAFRRFRK
jgi:hypothetical protein